MSYLVAGAVSGLLMAAVFLVVVPLMLFFLFKSRPPWFVALTDRVPPMKLMLGMVVFAYPTWAFVGVVLGLALLVVETVAPRDGPGTENLFLYHGGHRRDGSGGGGVLRCDTPGYAGPGGADARLHRRLRLGAAVPGLTTRPREGGVRATTRRSSGYDGERGGRISFAAGSLSVPPKQVT